MHFRMLVVALTIGTVGACGSNSTEPAPAQATQTEAPSSALSESTRAEVLAALGAYERLRAALAADTLDGVAAASQEVAAKSRAAAGTAPTDLKATLEAVSARAEAMSGVTDLDAGRHAFGELSQVVVKLTASDPALKDGRHVFMCPMAEGYQQWVQTSAELENPYMGQQMLACGGRGDWSK